MGSSASNVRMTASQKKQSYKDKLLKRNAEIKAFQNSVNELTTYRGDNYKSDQQKVKDAKLKEQFIIEAVLAHNEYRALHGSPELQQAEDLTAQAQFWAKELSSKDMLIHSKCVMASGERIGENIYMCWPSDCETHVKAIDVVRSWYNEISLYNFNLEKVSYKSAHFTQVVWKETRFLGIGYGLSDHGTVYVVANYRPAGNVLEKFHDNVLPRFSSAIDVDKNQDDDDASDSDTIENG